MALTPAQLEVRDRLFDLGGDRPTFRDGLARELRAALQAGLADVAERLELVGADLWLDKNGLHKIHTCERHWAAERAHGFPGWSPATARGVVSHRAIQLGQFLREPLPPADVVDLAIDRIALEGDDYSPAGWLKAAAPADLADLRAGAVEVVTKFEECFPPLVAAWRPRIESSFHVDLHGGTITLRARPDIALGKADGHTARVLIVDLKTGQPYQSHADDLRFYALVETLRAGVPPFRIASYYLDGARWTAEDVDEAVLHVAVRRTIDGARKLAAVQLGEREPDATVGPTCRFCVIRDDCDAAIAAASEPGAENP